MKKFYTIVTAATLVCFFMAFSVTAQNAWINEIHYDNASTDVDEIVEVVIENAGSYTLSDFQVDQAKLVGRCIVCFLVNNGSGWCTIVNTYSEADGLISQDFTSIVTNYCLVFKCLWCLCNY